MHEVETMTAATSGPPVPPAKTFADLIGRVACWRNLARKSLSVAQAVLVDLPTDREWLVLPMYHFIVDDERKGFDAQLRYMRRHGDFLSIDDAVSALTNPAGLGGRYFCVTFDDGVKNCVTNALPILAERRCPAVFYLATDYIGLTFERDWDAIHLFPQPYTGFRAAFDFMTWDECRALAAAGMTLGAHTCRHVRLAGLSDADAAREMRESKAEVERQAGVPCRHFAAPWGVPNRDFDPARHPAMARDAGFASFVTTAEGANRTHGDPYVLCRVALRGFNWTSQVHCVFAAATHAA
jgi:peptidoglycan/xylan/chitin deacetylase (PgdA/CDA1 family)